MSMTSTAVAYPLTRDDVREFFLVDYVEIEADGSIYVAGPVAGYELSREEIHSCLRHLAARRGICMVHRIPETRMVGRPAFM